jgi:hypothetical protein
MSSRETTLEHKPAQPVKFLRRVLKHDLILLVPPPPPPPIIPAIRQIKPFPGNMRMACRPRHHRYRLSTPRRRRRVHRPRQDLYRLSSPRRRRRVHRPRQDLYRLSSPRRRRRVRRPPQNLYRLSSPWRRDPGCERKFYRSRPSWHRLRRRKPGRKIVRPTIRYAR